MVGGRKERRPSKQPRLIDIQTKGRTKLRWTILAGVFWSCAVQRSSAFGKANATIGLLLPIYYPGPGNKVPQSWLQWASVSLLAVHHINTRNASVVGDETMSRIPENFTVSFKLADDGFTANTAAGAWVAWKKDACVAAFADSSCAKDNEMIALFNLTRATYEADLADYPHAFVGCARSDAAVIVSHLARLDMMPLMSFAATLSEFADKTRYPAFSRTNPGNIIQAQAMSKVSKLFGWTSYNILHVDSSSGNGWKSDLSMAAEQTGMTISSSQKFILDNPKSIEAAMSSLAGAVYNKTSGATRSRITILVGIGTGISMQWVIKFGLEKQVIGKGFVWIQFGASKVVEEMVSSVTEMPKELFRKAYTGFFSLEGPISPDDLGRSMLDTPRRFMYHSVLDKYGNLQYGPKWQDKALDPTFPGGGANHLAYDAVWATAIGLAAARQTKDKDAMKQVEVFSRSGGGRGPFKGASGVVSFGENGERAALGLQFVLSNIIPPAEDDTNWSLPVFTQVGWTDVARYESSVGLSKISSITPYWPGGERSWSAPPDHFPPEEPSQPTIVEKIVKTETIETKYVSIVDPVMVKMSLWLPIPMSEFNAAKEKLFIQAISRAAGVYVSQVTIQVKEQAIPRRRRQLSQGVSVNVQLAVEDSTVAKEVASKLTADIVNAQLATAGLPSAELLSAPEIVLPYQDSTNVAAIVAPTVVVVLALVAVAYVVYRCSTKPVRDEDDVSFEVCQVELRQALMLTQKNGYILSNETPSFFQRWFSSRKLVVIPRRHMEAAVRLWLLEDFDISAFDALCVMIADSEYNSRISEDVPSMAVQGVHGDAEFASQPMGKETQLRFLSMRSWQMRNENLELIRTWLLEFAVSVLKDIQKISFDSAQHVEKSDKVLISHFASFPSIQKKFERKTFPGNRRALEAYFREKIMAVHLWQANSCALFKDFKIPVEEMMKILADECFQRFKAIKNEPWGQEVCEFSWDPQRSEFSFESAAARSDTAVQDMDDVMRQDDEKVEAVRWSERDVAEKSYEKCKKLRRVCNKDLGADESVFISQLQRSAFLLDRAFKRKVVETLESSSQAIIISHSQATGHAKTLTQDRYTDFKRMVSREQTGDEDFAVWLSTDDGSGDSDLSSGKSENDTMGRLSPTSSSDGTALSTIELQESTGCVTVRVGAFQEEPDQVNVYFAPIKTRKRMEEKLKKYVFPHAWSTWPLAANIRDPIRLSIACDNPGHILQIVRLFLSSQASTGLRVVRVKNKFLQSDEEVKSGLNGLDLSLNALFEEPGSGLKIIGEIQVHDKKIQEVKSRIHKLYKIKRARNPTMIV